LKKKLPDLSPDTLTEALGKIHRGVLDADQVAILFLEESTSVSRSKCKDPPWFGLGNAGGFFGPLRSGW
jgi:hypothetical protein